MADTKTPVIEIRTLEAVKSVKDLKDNIAALKAKIEDVNTSTEDYSDLVSQLSQNQAALRNVMNGTHSSFQQSIQDAQGLNTSYNSLVQQLKDATQEWRAIPKYLSDADKAQGLVNQAWTDAATKVNTLRTELKGMDAETGNYTRNVGNYKSALDGFRGAMGQVQQVGGDMVNGISAAASSMAMLGINTDGLSESMNNLRIVTAAVQGAKGFAGLVKTLASYFKAGKNATAATKAQTVATQAEATAQNAANAATAQGSVALNGLQKALIATGIGALVVGLGMLVAHFEDIINWIGKLGEKFGLWKRDTDNVTGATDRLNKKIDAQNHALENEQKIRSAQGASNLTLLKQKKELVQQQINDTKATIENVKARIEQLKADDRWWKFWQGTKGKVKKATEELEGLKEVLENLNQISTDIDVDITVEQISEGSKAAKKNAEDAAAALKKMQEQIKEGTNVAISALRAEETEAEKLDREFKENAESIKEAIDLMKQLSGETADVAELEKGLAALKSKYYRNKFEADAAEASQKISEEAERQYESIEGYENLYAGVFGLDKERLGTLAKASAAEEKRYDILKSEMDFLRGQVDLTDDVLKTLTGVSYDDLVKEYEEPLATAIRMYFQKSKEVEKAGYQLYETIFKGYEDSFNKKLSQGDIFGAKEIAEQFTGQFALEFIQKKNFLGFWDYYQETFEKTLEQLEADAESPGSIYLKALFPQGDIDALRVGIKFAEDAVKESFDAIQQYRKDTYPELGLFEYDESTEEAIAAIGRYNEECMKLDVLEQQLFKKRIERFTSANAQIVKYFNTYGKATTNLMDSVADAWEAALQAQVKNGKKSEKEAKRSFGFVKALQLSSAVINASAAVVQALADPTVPSYYVKVANAAAAAAAGIAQVIKISNTEFSASASNSTENTPQLVDRTPQLNYVVGLNSNEYAAAQAENPIRAYVVDKDIADGVEQYNRRRDETSF